MGVDQLYKLTRIALDRMGGLRYITNTVETS